MSIRTFFHSIATLAFISLALVGFALTARAMPVPGATEIVLPQDGSISIAASANGASAKSAPIDMSASSSAMTPSFCPSLSHGLARGMRDSDGAENVKGLQKFLAHHFGTPEVDLATGYFGPITEAHVMRFQTEQGITPIGLVGPLTRSAIAKLCGNAGNPTKPHVSITVPKGGEGYTFKDSIPVSWTTMHVATHTGMYLKLTTTDGQIIKSITVPYAQGSTTIDTSGSCNGDFSDAIHGECENLKYELKDGKKPFKIEAGLFTPEGACFGFCAPSTTPTVIIAKAESSAFTMEDPDAGAFTATSTSGKAPLTTTFTIARGGSFTLSFGDEEMQAFSIDAIVCITTPCNPTHTIPHTYKKPGQYYAVLTRNVVNDCKPTAGTVCAMWVSREETVGTITIDVTDPKKN